jgi:hypothetical protein
MRNIRHLNFGMTGTDMRGGGSGGILEALPMPLGSTPTLFIPPALAGPGGIPLMGIFPVPASPACLAEEAAGVATTMSSMIKTFAEVSDMMILQELSRALRSVKAT